MMDDDAPFHAQGLFTGLTREEGEEILAAGSPISFPSEAAIFRSGDHGDAMYVITKGAAKVELWKRATSLGGVESLIEHRASVEGPSSPCPDDLLRLSVGLEDPDDLYTDLDQALRAAS